ncbi:MAG TPA: response regulator transcription factor [Bacteroidia bacterium]
MKKIKLLIVDDHSIVREGIKTMLKDISDFAIVGEAENGKEAIAQAKKLSPDLIIMDISMPVMNGIEAIQVIKNDFPHIKTLVLTIHSETEYIEQIFISGATGCLYKNAGKDEFELAIRTIYKGENYFCSGISNIIMRGYIDNKGEFHFNSGNPLTKREQEILRLITEEYSNKQIADKLSISTRTVETHRKNMMQKLNVKTTIALIKYAIEQGIVN